MALWSEWAAADMELRQPCAWKAKIYTVLQADNVLRSWCDLRNSRLHTGWLAAEHVCMFQRAMTETDERFDKNEQLFAACMLTFRCQRFDNEHA